MKIKENINPYDLDEVLSNARGYWDGILDLLAGKELATALSNVKKGSKAHTSCPVHGGKNGDGFRLFPNYNITGGGVCNTCGAKKTGIALLMWVNGWTFFETLEAVAKELGMERKTGDQSNVTPPIRRTPLPEVVVDEEQIKADNKKYRQKQSKVWRESLSLDHPLSEPARLYFARRGLTHKGLPEGVVRFHRSLPSYKEVTIEVVDEDGEILQKTKYECEGFFPTIVCLVTNKDNIPINIHRTYITIDGVKAPVISPKKLMMRPSDVDVSGSAIRIAEHGEVLGATEGLETAMAVMQATGIPVWPAINAELLKGFVPPEEVKLVCNYADKDRSKAGERAAKVLIPRLWQVGFQALAFFPKMEIPEGEKGVDWLDVYNRYGAKAIPTAEKAREIINNKMGDKAVA